MISLHTYQLLEDAWHGGIEAWCRAASKFALTGGQAWIITVNDSQANAIKRRLLRSRVCLFGVQFLDARAVRRKLCQRLGLPARTLGQNTLELLLRLRAITAAGEGGARCATVARHPGTCLAALDDYAASGWLKEPGSIDEILPDELIGFLPELQRLDAWTPEIDRRLLQLANRRTVVEGKEEAPRPLDFATIPMGAERAPEPLSLCVVGWDAGQWPLFDLLQAAVLAANTAYVFTPSPRGTSEGVQQGWLEACEEAFGVGFETCESAGFVSAQAALVGRLEGTDYLAATFEDRPVAPELLTGVDGADAAALVCDFAARWLAAVNVEEEDEVNGRLAILCPRRTPAAVATVRALTAAGINVEDELGEIAEPTLAVQIQRAILDYQQNRGGLESLLTVVELLNQQVTSKEIEGPATVLREVFPLDPVEVRRALHGAFAEVQHHDARFLCEAMTFARTEVGRALQRLIRHLAAWPETLSWTESLRRRCEGLAALGLSIDSLEPLWSQLQGLDVPDPVPSATFFQHFTVLLAGTAARRPAAAAHRFARVVVTTLEGASCQSWGGVVWLDSNEGLWPLYPPENPFFDDANRARFNARRAELKLKKGQECPHHLLTSADRAQLEHFRFLETLENCSGPVAFASSTRDITDQGRELYPNEWLLRCLVESGPGAVPEETLLDRWRRSTRQIAPARLRLTRPEAKHLGEIYRRRRDPAVPFDEHFFNFQSLTGPDELPWAEAWSAGELDTAWNQPATFAISQVLAAEPWRDLARSLVRGESWIVGRLVHQWVPAALGLTRTARRFTAEDWTQVLHHGLTRIQAETDAASRSSFTRSRSGAEGPVELDLWWQGILGKASRAAYRCLETLAATASIGGQTEQWMIMARDFQAALETANGPLRLRARCDLVLLDRPELAGATCQLIDFRTGAVPPSGPLTLAKVQTGKGLNLVALLFMARAEGANAGATYAGVLHPEGSNLALVDQRSAPMLQPAMDALAREQHTLVFGQKGAVVDESGHGVVENLPLATTPIELEVLARKGALVRYRP